MRGWKVAAPMVLTTLLGWTSAAPAVASPPIAYGGRAIAAKASVSGQTTILADTGELSSSGGSLEASSLSGAVPGSLIGDTLHASTIGQGDRTTSEASLTSVGLTAGLNVVSADLAMSRAAAVKHGSSVKLNARSHVDTLMVNGLPVVITGAANQTVPVLDGQLVINEQSTSTGGTIQSITVNALHLTVGDVDVVLGTSTAGVSTGSSNCSGQRDFATGGGWAPPSGNLKRSLGFIGGIRQNGTVHGHLVFINRTTDERLEGVVTVYPAGQQGDTRVMQGNGQVNGQPASFTLNIQDNGEPGVADDFTLTYLNRLEIGPLNGGNIQIHAMCS